MISLVLGAVIMLIVQVLLMQAIASLRDPNNNMNYFVVYFSVLYFYENFQEQR